MTMHRRKFNRLLIAGGGALLAAPFVHGQGTWPNKPIRVIVPYTPGGFTDNVARMVSQKLTERLGQQVMRRRVETVRFLRDALAKRGDGPIPLFQPHPGHPELKGGRRLSRLNLLRIFQGFRRFLPVRQTKAGRPFDKVSRR